MITRLFTEHPATVGESYFEHLLFALRVGSMMILCGIACLIHSIFPFVFETTASDFIRRMHKKLKTRSATGADAIEETRNPEEAATTGSEIVIPKGTVTDKAIAEWPVVADSEAGVPEKVSA